MAEYSLTRIFEDFISEKTDIDKTLIKLYKKAFLYTKEIEGIDKSLIAEISNEFYINMHRHLNNTISISTNSNLANFYRLINESVDTVMTYHKPIENITVETITLMPSIEDAIINKIEKNNNSHNFNVALRTLTQREEFVLRLKYDVDRYIKPRWMGAVENPNYLLHHPGCKTLEEIGKIFNVTRERISQIEIKALRKLRHPGRRKLTLDVYFEESILGSGVINALYLEHMLRYNISKKEKFDLKIKNREEK